MQHQNQDESSEKNTAVRLNKEIVLPTTDMTRLATLVVYPIKSLDGVRVSQRAFDQSGALSGDRSYALVEPGVDPATASVGGAGGYINGKREPRLHRLHASYEFADAADPTPTAVTLERPASDTAGADTATFALPDDGDALASWVSAFVGYPVEFVCESAGSFPDDRTLPGPTVTSVGTLAAVAEWFDEIEDATEVRRRFRPNLVFEDCPAFFEDRLFDAHGTGVAFSVGAAALIGVNPCQRCAVPSRHPDTGRELDGFRERFIDRRRASLPAWTMSDRFDHDFRLMVNTAVPARTRGVDVAVGDEVTVQETVPFDPATDTEYSR